MTQPYHAADTLVQEPGPQAAARSRHRWLWVLGVAGLCLALAAGLGFARTRLTSEPVVIDESGPRRVRVAEVKRLDVSRDLRFAGVMRSSLRASVSFTVSGRLTKRLVSVGDKVVAGQVIAELDKAPFENQVSGATAAVGQAGAALSHQRRRRRRSRSLAHESVISESQLEETGYRVRSTTAQRQRAGVELREAKRRLAEASLVAPFSGVVTEVRVEIGEYVAPGRPLFVITGDAGLELDVEVPEAIVAGLAPGRRVRVVFPRLEQTVAPTEGSQGHPEAQGQIAAVTHPGPQVGRLFLVEVELGKVPGVLPGMTAEVVLPSDQTSDLAVPLRAVNSTGAPGDGQTIVYRVTDGVVEVVEVEIQEVVGDMVTVTGTLQFGDELVLGGHTGLIEGETVEPRR